MSEHEEKDLAEGGSQLTYMNEPHKHTAPQAMDLIPAVGSIEELEGFILNVVKPNMGNEFLVDLHQEGSYTYHIRVDLYNEDGKQVRNFERIKEWCLANHFDFYDQFYSTAFDIYYDDEE